MKKRTLVTLAAAVICAAALGGKAGAQAWDGCTAGIIDVDTKLNVRQEANSRSAILDSLKPGSYVTIAYRSGNWYRVEYDTGTYGWVYADYVDKVSGSWAGYADIDSGTLNVRLGPGTGYTAAASLTKGESFVVLGEKNGWYRILFGGDRIGWVSGNYVSSFSGAAAGEKYAAVQLSVPRYAQTDSRWSAVRLGSSSATMGAQGCAVTCLAMSETYRTGATVTPAAMESRLQFTSGGAVYWPGGYTVLQGNVDLKLVYEKLCAGSPVIVGLQKYSGGTHFVLVTGFTGGGSLTADRFTINDPATAARTTLGQVMQTYPISIRTVYMK